MRSENPLSVQGGFWWKMRSRTEKSRIWWTSATRTERLECSKRLETIINRKIIIFYIEAIPPKNFQLQKKYIFSESKKCFSKIFEKISKIDHIRPPWTLVIALKKNMTICSTSPKAAPHRFSARSDHYPEPPGPENFISRIKSLTLGAP